MPVKPCGYSGNTFCPRLIPVTRRFCDEHEIIIDVRRIKTTIVCGPPGAGKSRWVSVRMKRGDLIVDMDRLYQALSGLKLRDKPECLLPFVCEARDAVIERIARGATGVRHAWIITSSPDKNSVEALSDRLGAIKIVIAASPDECRRRMKRQGRSAGHIEEMVMKCEEWERGWE